MPVDATLSAIEKILHWLSPRFMLFVLLVSVALFFMPPAWAAYLSLDHWIATHRFWPGMGMVVSALYLIPFGISPPIEKKIAGYGERKKLSRVMADLAEDEKRLLRQFYFPNREGHIMAWPHEIGKLETDGILFCPGESGLKDTMQRYSLTVSARHYIGKHQEFLTELERTKAARY